DRCAPHRSRPQPATTGQACGHDGISHLPAGRCRLRRPFAGDVAPDRRSPKPTGGDSLRLCRETIEDSVRGMAMNEADRIRRERRRLRSEYKELYDEVSRILYHHDPIRIN